MRVLHIFSAVLMTTVDVVYSRSSIWESIGTRDISSYEAMMSVRSAIECVRQCVDYWPFCVTVGYIQTSGQCYLHPTVSSGGSESVATIYVNTDPICKETATFPNGNVTSWQRSLTSLRGVVACHSDYIPGVGASPEVRCLSSGQWTTSGMCNQRIWKNNTVVTGKRYNFPRPLSISEAVCLTATPNASSWFSVKLWHNIEANLPFRLKATFESLMISLNSKNNGEYGSATQLQSPDHPFPFVVSQQFQMNITASESDRLKVYVDGSLLAEWTTSVSVDNINKISIQQDLRVHFMDLACGH